MNLNPVIDWLFGRHDAPTLGAPAATQGTPPSVFGINGKAACAPAFKPLGDNSAWFVFHGVEVALIVLMLIGILAILFGDPQTDVNIAEVAAA